jgi:hypothetical protein
MSDQDNTTENMGENQQEDGLSNMSELALLKSRAGMLGITFSNNIGVEALKIKIDEKLAGITPENETTNEEINALSMTEELSKLKTTDGAPLREPTLRERIHSECMALVRCRITNMNPNKKDLPGEIVVVANEFLGTVRKYIPFGEFTDEGYHIPKVLYDMLMTRKFLNITTSRDRRTGAQTVKTAWANEFAIEVLPPLTKAELAQLAQAQIAAGSLDSVNAA